MALADLLSSITLCTLRSVHAEELAQVNAIDLLVKVTKLEVSIHHLPATLPADCFATHVCHRACRIPASLRSIIRILVGDDSRLHLLQICDNILFFVVVGHWLVSSLHESFARSWG